jgi:hypothetical protein
VNTDGFVIADVHALLKLPKKHKIILAGVMNEITVLGTAQFMHIYIQKLYLRRYCFTFFWKEQTPKRLTTPAASAPARVKEGPMLAVTGATAGPAAGPRLCGSPRRSFPATLTPMAPVRHPERSWHPA